MIEGVNKIIVKYSFEKGNVRFVGGHMTLTFMFGGAQYLTLRRITNLSLSLGFERVFYREFHTYLIHMSAMTPH